MGSKRISAHCIADFDFQRPFGLQQTAMLVYMFDIYDQIHYRFQEKARILTNIRRPVWRYGRPFDELKGSNEWVSKGDVV